MNPGRKTEKNTEFEQASLRYAFPPFELDPVRQLLYKNGEPVQLNPKAFEILLVLVENRDRAVGKEELMSAVWADTTVEEVNINRNISFLRRALGEGPDDHRFILTVPRHGYRFVAEVKKCGEEGGPEKEAPTQPSELQGMPMAPSALRIRSRRVLAAGLAVAAGVAMIALYIAYPSGKSRAKTGTAAGPAAEQPSAAAREFYSRGRLAWNTRSQKASGDAIEYMKRATELDPSYAEAWAGLADAYILHAFYSPDDATALPSAKSAAFQALKLNKDLAGAHASLGAVHALYDWDWDGCEREFQRALELESNNVQTMDWHAILCRAPRGKLDEAAAELQNALEIEPLSANLWTDLGWVRVFQRRDGEAIEACRTALRIDPAFMQAHVRLEEAYEDEGRYTQAVAENEAVDVLHRGSAPRPYPVEISRTLFYESLRDSLIRRQGISAPSLRDATMWAFLGEKVRAMQGMQQSVNSRDPEMIYLGVDPRLDSLRDDPAFRAIERRIGILSESGS
jgi:DNA-binding winged helix-turn-helix (wHTH) protein/Tfp pilus assembly protein PilF